MASSPETTSTTTTNNNNNSPSPSSSSSASQPQHPLPRPQPLHPLQPPQPSQQPPPQTTTTTTTTTTPTPTTNPTAAAAAGEENDTASLLSFFSASSPSNSPAHSPPPSPPHSPPPSPIPAPSAIERRRALTCSMCLEIFRNPKLLPCSHTFCQRCLERLVARIRTPAPAVPGVPTTVVFKCPNCRRGIVVPEGGVRSLQNNFYIVPEDLAIARDGTHCLSHPEQSLDLYCTECALPICLKCKLTRHEDHKVTDVTDACLEARQKLKKHQKSVQEELDSMLQQLEMAKKEQQTQLDKRTAMESIIRKQHGTLVAAAEKFLVEALATLKSASEGGETNLHQQVITKTQDVEKLRFLQGKLDQTVNNDNRYKLIATAREETEGKGSLAALDHILSGTKEVFPSDLQPDFILSHFRQFLTTVNSVDAELKACTETTIESGVFKVKHIKVCVSVTRQFKCGKRHDSEVFCVCPLDDDTVWVSYIKDGTRDPPPAEKYDEDGKLLCCSEKMLGEVAFKSIGNGKVRHLIPFGGGTRSFSKWGNSVHYKLSNSVEGKATITKVEVITEEPFNAKLTEEVTIKVGPHRGFDVDSEGELFVVLEEPLPPETKRQVKMYNCEDQDPVAIYTPPTTNFQASDVCFCRLGSDAAVLVADEQGDSIHVLGVKPDGTMTFLRYLAPGAPSLVQPTALNVDTQGRLWVACVGGHLLTMYPVT